MKLFSLSLFSLSFCLGVCELCEYNNNNSVKQQCLSPTPEHTQTQLIVSNIFILCFIQLTITVLFNWLGLRDKCLRSVALTF